MIFLQRFAMATSAVLALLWLGAIGFLLAAGVWAALAPRPTPAAPSEPVEQLPDYVVFIDRFTSIDATRWIISDGWSNGDWTENDWRATQARAGAGGLALVMEPNPPGAQKRFASGELQSQELFQYGYIEARLRVPRGEGIVTGLFTYTRDEGVRSWHEIDMEFVGRDTRSMELTYFIGGRATKHIHQLGFDAAGDFHTYAIEWTPEAIRWYIDNRLVHEAADRAIARMSRPQRLYLNLWSTDQLWRWTGNVDPAEAPWTLSANCIARAREYRGQSLCAM